MHAFLKKKKEKKGSIRDGPERGSRTTLRAVIFKSNIFLQVRNIDDLTAGELARGTGECDRVAVGSDTWRTVRILCYTQSSAANKYLQPYSCDRRNCKQLPVREDRCRGSRRR